MIGESELGRLAADSASPGFVVSSEIGDYPQCGSDAHDDQHEIMHAASGEHHQYALVSKKREDARGQTQVAGFVLSVTLYFGPSTSSL
jgi:hypothetical protein